MNLKEFIFNGRGGSPVLRKMLRELRTSFADIAQKVFYARN